jgi:uncharacterized RDD family membrane protein YckC
MNPGAGPPGAPLAMPPSPADTRPALSVADTRRLAISAANVSAGASLRFVAFAIDYVGFFAVYAVVWVPVVVTTGYDPASLTFTGAGGTVLAVIYMTIMEGARGTTVGKIVCRLHVTMADGTPLQWSAAVLRNVFKLLALLLWVLGMVVTLVAILDSPVKQRIGDRVARTIVVREVPPAIRDGRT